MKYEVSPLHRGERGFNLVEVLIGSALLMILILGLTSVTTFSNRATVSTLATSEFNSLVSSIQGVLNHTQNCATALGVYSLPVPIPVGAISPPTSVSPIKSQGNAGTDLAKVGQWGKSLDIKKIEFNFVTALPAIDQYLVTLRLAADKTIRGGAVGGSNLSHDFLVSVTVDPGNGNKIIACSAQVDTLWQKGANGTDIFYSVGKVGIGTTTPNSALELSTNGSTGLWVDTTDPASQAYVRFTVNEDVNTRWELGRSGTTNPDPGNFYLSRGNLALADRVLTATPTGKIGIGTTAPVAKLHVVTNGPQGHAHFERSGKVFAIDPNTSDLNAVTQLKTDAGMGLGLYVDSAAGVGGTQAIHIASNGNVGISTAAPEVELHVKSLDAVTGNGDVGVESEDGFQWTMSSVKTTGAWVLNRDIPGTQVTMVALQNGNVGIGGNLAPAYKLDVTGDINASGVVRASGTALTSDARFKKDIKILDRSLEKILRLRGVSYRWKADEFPEKHFDDRAQIGVIAQEVEMEFPELVDTDPKGYQSVNYPALIAPLIEAIKTLNEALRAENEKLKQENVAIKAYLCGKDPSAAFCH